MAAIAAWRLVEWKRSALAWLLVAVLVLSAAAVHWLPRQPAIDQAFRPSGMLNSIYGFNIFALHSVAGDRMLQILGLFGVVNLAAALILMRCNHVVAWLSLMPVLAMSVPFVSIPFAGILSTPNWSGVIAFIRMFLAIPAGLAVVTVARRLISSSALAGSKPALDGMAYALALSCLLMLNLIPPASPFYNRFWQALLDPPRDLCLADSWTDFYRFTKFANYAPHEVFAGTPAMDWMMATERQVVLTAFDGERTYYNNGSIPSVCLGRIRTSFSNPDVKEHLVVLVIDPTSLYTTRSFAAVCSGHWLPQEAIFAAAGAKEVRIAANDSGFSTVATFGGTSFYNGN